HVARFDGAFLDGSERSFFAVKYSRGAAELLQIVPGNFDDAALRRKISFQDDQAARGFERRVKFADDFLPRSFLCCIGVFPEGAAGYREAFTAKKSAFQHALGHQRCPACCIEIGGDESSSRLQIGENGNTRTDAIEIVNGKRNLL